MVTRKYEPLIAYSRDLSIDEKDLLNLYYEKAFEILGIHYDSKPLALKQLAIYIVKDQWKKCNIDSLEKLIDDWFHYYELGFIEYKSSFEILSDDFDLHLTYAVKFIKEKLNNDGKPAIQIDSI